MKEDNRMKHGGAGKNKQVLPGNKQSPWFKRRLAVSSKILETAKQEQLQCQASKISTGCNFGVGG